MHVIARSRVVACRSKGSRRLAFAVSVIATGVAMMAGAAGASAAPPDVAYTTATDGTAFATLDSSTGAGTLLGSTGQSQGWAVAFDAMWTTVDGFGATRIATVDKVTGHATPVGGPVIARETPALVRPDSELYAVPAVAGAVAVAIAWELDAYGPVLGAVAAAVFGVRCLALHRHWRGPRAWRRPVPAADAAGT